MCPKNQNRAGRLLWPQEETSCSDCCDTAFRPPAPGREVRQRPNAPAGRSMTSLLPVLFDGVVYASWLFLMASGLTLIYGVMRILNIAHGSLYALGAYAAASLTGAWLAGGYAAIGSYAMLLAAALLVGAVMGPLLERGLLKWMYGRDE